MSDIAKVAALLGAAFFISSCSTIGSFFSYSKLPEINEKDTYRHELQVDVNGVRINGVGVARLTSSYKVRVYPPGNVDRLIWRTCSKEELIDKPAIQNSKSWVFGSGYNYVDFVYTPAFGLDDANSCALKIEVFEEKKRRNGLALVEFQSSREDVSLIADLLCNGEFSQNRGVSACQSAAGLYQQISFPVPVVNKDVRPECDVMKPVNGDEKIYRFVMPPSGCVFSFVAKDLAPNGKNYRHWLTTNGYTDVPPIK